MALFFSFLVERAIRSVQVNQDVLKINSTHQFLDYADDVNICVTYCKGKHRIFSSC